MELIRAADILIEKIEKDYRGDVALVVVMGSYIYNDTHGRSDLDMFFVPTTRRGRNLSFTFILDDIGFDYWDISWERLERIAGYEEPITSIITEGKVLYCASESDRRRFDALKARALDTSTTLDFVTMAGRRLEEAYGDYRRLLQAQGLSDARMSSVAIIQKVAFALALVNRITVKRGRGKLKQEIMDMPLVPLDFATLYDTVFLCDDIHELQHAYGRMLENTGALIAHEREAHARPCSFVEKLGGFYEEAINFYNNIYRACEIGDRHAALFAAVGLTDEIDKAFAGTGVSPRELPDVVREYDPDDLERLAGAAQEHQKRFVQLLKAQGVRLNMFDSYEGLKEYLAAL